MHCRNEGFGPFCNPSTRGLGPNGQQLYGSEPATWITILPCEASMGLLEIQAAGARIQSNEKGLFIEVKRATDSSASLPAKEAPGG